MNEGCIKNGGPLTLMIKVLIATAWQIINIAGCWVAIHWALAHTLVYVDSISPLFMHTYPGKNSHMGPYAKSHERSFIMRIYSRYAHAHSHHRLANKILSSIKHFFCQISRWISSLACVYTAFLGTLEWRGAICYARRLRGGLFASAAPNEIESWCS